MAIATSQERSRGPEAAWSSSALRVLVDEAAGRSSRCGCGDGGKGTITGEVDRRSDDRQSDRGGSGTVLAKVSQIAEMTLRVHEELHTCRRL